MKQIICPKCGQDITESMTNKACADELRADLASGKESGAEFGELLAYLETQDPNGIIRDTPGICTKCGYIWHLPKQVQIEEKSA